MGVFVTVSCDAAVREGTCVASVLGRLGEDIPETLRRAGRVGWILAPGRVRCPWHASGKFGGTGALALYGRGGG